jgi:hypothetical protein
VTEYASLSDPAVQRALGRKRSKRRSRQTPVADLLQQIELAGLHMPVPEIEYRFWPGRKFAFDIAFVEAKLAVEVDGGVFLSGGGRHNRGTGYRSDCEKLGEAAARGWRVIRCLPEHIYNGMALSWIDRALRVQ